MGSEMCIRDSSQFSKPNLPPFIYPRTARKTARMLRELYDTGFASFS